MNKKKMLILGAFIVICIMVIMAYLLKRNDDMDNFEETVSTTENSTVKTEESITETDIETGIGSEVITYENYPKYFTGIRHIPAQTYTSVSGEIETNPDGYSVVFSVKTNSPTELIMPAYVEQGNVISVAIEKTSLSKITFEEGIEEILVINVSDVEEVVVPASAKKVNFVASEIGNIVFAPNGKLKYFSLFDINKDKITLPNTIKYMESSFHFSSKVVSVELPECLTEMNDCFISCSALEQVDIPDTVAKISEHCFSNCPKLTLVVGKDSYAETFAREHNISYQYRE